MSTPPSLRTLLVVRHLPSPPRDGGGLRRLRLVDALAGLGPTFVFGLGAAGPAPRPDLAGWRAASSPEASRTPQGREMLDALKAERSPFTTVESPATVTELLALVDEFAPDLVVVSGSELFDYVGVLRPRVERLVLDLDYAQAAGFGEMARADPNRQRGLLWRHALPRLARDETVAVQKVDQVWIGVAREAALLRESVAEPAPIAIIPNVVDVGSYTRATRADPSALVYAARFDYWPNEEAARVLIEEIVPRLPEASLALVGAAPPAWLLAQDDPRVTVTGAVPEVRPYLTAASVMPVPLTAGTGTRLKVLEAFATGLPVVSTEKGVEGLGLAPERHYLRAEQPEEFVAAITRLRDDPALANALVDESFALVDSCFSLDALRAAVADAVR